MSLDLSIILDRNEDVIGFNPMIFGSTLNLSIFFFFIRWWLCFPNNTLQANAELVAEKTADEFGKKHVKGGCQHQPIAMGRCTFVFDFPSILVSFSCAFFRFCVRGKKGVLMYFGCKGLQR